MSFGYQSLHIAREEKTILQDLSNHLAGKVAEATVDTAELVSSPASASVIALVGAVPAVIYAAVFFLEAAQMDGVKIRRDVALNKVFAELYRLVNEALEFELAKAKGEAE